MKLHEIKGNELELLKKRYAELYKTLKDIKSDIDWSLGDLKTNKEKDSTKIYIAWREDLEDLDNTVSRVLTKHDKPLF